MYGVYSEVNPDCQKEVKNTIYSHSSSWMSINEASAYRRNTSHITYPAQTGRRGQFGHD